ncbi:dynein heavy chain 6, axonemal [Elysia marginata]|uniref:Dynein heavy chain 6, axonemal n=1 Tax=Elysia marginata TaxID=1093978 RepID=A0AAV4FCC2_9GAST|nr:dynein heavy chain 6, axonemal [Elysia marginata]
MASNRLIVGHGDVEGEQQVQSNGLLNDPASRAQRLKARLYSYAPMVAKSNPGALQFRGVTRAQAKRVNSPLGPHIEPLPSLHKYQTVNRPDYIQKKNLESLELKRRAAAAEESTDGQMKKMKRAGSVEPLDVIPRAPDLPEELKEKQEEMAPRPMTPRDSLKSPKGRSHTSGPSVSATTRLQFPTTFEGIRDMHHIIKILREQPKVGFLYLSPAVPKVSVNYHYYNLK